MKARILIVDDNDHLRRALVRRLGVVGDVVEAGDLHGARLALAEPLDVVLTDEELPDGAGRTLLVEVRDRQPKALRLLMSGGPVSICDPNPPWQAFLQRSRSPRTS